MVRNTLLALLVDIMLCHAYTIATFASVFILLETLFKSFDEIAGKHRIFKGRLGHYE